MSIKEMTAYSMRCDGCDVEFEACDFTIWATMGDLLDAADGCDWDVYRNDKRHLCDECKYAEDLEVADNVSE